MNLPDLSFLSPSNLISIAAIIFLGVVTIILSSREDKIKKHLEEKEKELHLREDFTHMMVHELRSPLTAIKDSAELIISSRKLDRKEQVKLLRIIEEQSKMLLKNVSSILDAAKIQAGKFTIQKMPADIKKTVEESVQVFTPQAKTKDIKITADFEKDLPHVSFDPSRIEQVINNLISNSLKFTPEKGKINISVKKDGERKKTLLVSVVDTGMGIPKDKQGKLFSKFSQILQNGNGENLGTGLGLFITKGIVEAHGGVISLDSEEGKGTTISFTLPLH